MLYISEIFESVQGEGITIGRPALFIRLMGCNLNCEWCDTPYSIGKLPTKSREDVIVYSVDSLIKEVINKYNGNRIVFTGGEPMLQRKEIIQVLKGIKNIKYVEIETNGTVPIMSFVRDYVVDYNTDIEKILFNFSPKLKHSNNENCFRDTVEDNIRYLRNRLAMYNRFDYIVKCVVRTDKHLERDWDEAEGKYFDFSDIHKCFVMAEGINEEEIKEGFRVLVEYNKKRHPQYNISPRVQNLVWGNVKGK